MTRLIFLSISESNKTSWYALPGQSHSSRWRGGCLDFYGCIWLQRNTHPAAYCSFQLPFLLSRNSSFLNAKKKVKVSIERRSSPVNFRPQMTKGWQREGCNQDRLLGSLMTRHSSAVLNASRPALGVTGSQRCAAEESHRNTHVVQHLHSST